MPFRVGIGYDIHRFSGDITSPEKQYVTICGVEIVHSKSLEAHSDGDLGMHALTDALLGCMGEGSIGQHFSNKDPRWKGMNSSYFLSEARRIALSKGYVVLNCDVTIVCEEPKILPYVPRMRACIAELLQINIGATNVKAVTSEGLGALGREEGIAAHAVVLCHRAVPKP